MEKVLSDKLGGENDFESLMEESLKAPRSGDVLVGRVMLITRDHVIIDINYKCEGQVPLAEFERTIDTGDIEALETLFERGRRMRAKIR